jgi:hypothetical protein
MVAIEDSINKKGFSCHPKCAIRPLLIGQEKSPLFIIEHWLEQAEDLVHIANQGPWSKDNKQDFYPGQRSIAPLEYRQFVIDFIQQQLMPLLPVRQHHQASISYCSFSMVTSSPIDLLPIQRIPHFDTHNDHQWAIVHYLCQEECGGTGFFQHRHSGFETIDSEREARYIRIRDDEAFTLGLPPARYLEGSSEQFKLIHHVNAQFNRAIIYPSNLLHSGLIKQWRNELGQPWRLTANSFIQLSADSPLCS